MSTVVKYTPRRKAASGVKPLPMRRGPNQRWAEFAPKLVVGGSLAALEAKLAGIRAGATV